MPNSRRSCSDCGAVESSEKKLQVCLDDDVRCFKCKSKRWPSSPKSPGKNSKGHEMRVDDFHSLSESLQFISDQVTQMNRKMDGTDKKVNDLLKEVASLKAKVKQKHIVNQVHWTFMAKLIGNEGDPGICGLTGKIKSALGLLIVVYKFFHLLLPRLKGNQISLGLQIFNSSHKL